MTRYDLKIGAVLLAGVVVLGLIIGFVVGTMTQPRDQVLRAEPSAPVSFEETGRSDGGAATVDGIPGWSDLYVNDYEDLLDDTAEARIRDQLTELYGETGIEMTVLTIADMIAYGHSGTIEEFATKTFNAWGIGDATRNNGVLILVSRFDRQMRIELGAGYGQDRDADMKRIIDTAFLPAFRDDAYQAGIETGVEETIFEVSGRYPGQFDQPTISRGWSIIGRRAADFGAGLLVPLIAMAGAGWLGFRRYLRRRPRPCPECRTMMVLAGEDADDAHLDGGQKLEEYLGSVDYDVWYCPSCAHNSIHGYSRWNGKFETCTDCGYQTYETTSRVLEEATRYKAGRKRLDYHCKNCDHRDHEVRTIPMIKDSDSSSSGSRSGSSRSSFGGGSSSGGGASGSW